MRDELTNEQIAVCYNAARLVGEVLQEEKLPPVSGLVVAAILARAVAKPGHTKKVAEALKNLVLAIDDQLKLRSPLGRF